MTGETNISKLIKTLTPILNPGEYVFATINNSDQIDRTHTICEFKEKEGITIVVDRKIADKQKIAYDYIASWITLTVHSSLASVGLTALFSTELAKHNISCNVIAGYYHDHIFVAKNDAQKAIDVLIQLSKNHT